MSYSQVLCLTALFSLLCNSVEAATSERRNVTLLPRAHDLSSRRSAAESDDEGWFHYNSVGLMLPVQGLDCAEVGCDMHGDSLPVVNALPGGLLGRSLNAVPTFDSRDIFRRTGAVSFDNQTGEPSFILDKSEDEDNDSGATGVSQPGEGSNEFPVKRDDSTTSYTTHSAKRRNAGILSSLFKRTQNSKLKQANAVKTHKKSKSSNALVSAVADIMSGATIL